MRSGKDAEIEDMRSSKDAEIEDMRSGKDAEIKLRDVVIFLLICYIALKFYIGPTASREDL